MHRKLTSKIGKEQTCQRKSRFVDDMAANSARLSAPVETEQVTPGRVLVVSQRLMVPITPGAFSSTLQELGADLVDIANVREGLAVVSQDIGDTELQRYGDPTESNSVHGRRPTPQSARRPLRVLLISSRRSSIVIESPRGACTRK